jgi:hypothetical protein
MRCDNIYMFRIVTCLLLVIFTVDIPVLFSKSICYCKVPSPIQHTKLGMFAELTFFLLGGCWFLALIIANLVGVRSVVFSLSL